MRASLCYVVVERERAIHIMFWNKQMNKRDPRCSLHNVAFTQFRAFLKNKDEKEQKERTIDTHLSLSFQQFIILCLFLEIPFDKFVSKLNGGGMMMKRTRRKESKFNLLISKYLIIRRTMEIESIISFGIITNDEIFSANNSLKF